MISVRMAAVGALLCSQACASTNEPPSVAVQEAAPRESAPPPRAFRVRDGFVSLFVLPAGDGKVALVDCGVDPSGVALLAGLKENGIAPADVEAIFVTHRHADHVGGCALFPKARVHAFATTGSDPLVSALPLRDGETVSVGRLRIKAYPVPGHTADSGAFLVDGVLYLGDSATAGADGKTIKPSPWIFNGEEKRRDDAQQNGLVLVELHKRLKAEDVTVRELAFGHSDSMTDFDVLIRTSAAPPTAQQP